MSEKEMQALPEAANFIEQIINEDIAAGKLRPEQVQTRFPPEPNGYLHIGHAKSMFVNFGTALKYGGKCNLFFDDTNPSKEKTEFVDAIRADIHWLGYEWARECYASDFFDTIYEYAVRLIKEGKAFVCDLSAEEIKNTRGTLTEPGTESPYRGRSPEENLRLFEEMRAGKYADGEKCLRAKIDMASPNVNLRDPVIYRILHASHHRTGGQVVHLPDVRLRPPHLRLFAGGDALALHTRIRGSPPVVRLGGHHPRLRPQAPPDRVRAAEHHQHGDEQALPQKAGRGGQGARLGRPPHAHPLRPAQPRHPRGRRARLLLPHRRRQGAVGVRIFLLRSVRARVPQRPRRARDGGARPSQSYPHRLRGGGAARLRRQPDGRERREARGQVRQAPLHRRRRLLPRSAPQVLPPQAGRLCPP